MILSSRSKALIALALFVPLMGCADYLNNRDTVSFRGGNAAEANTAIQEISPYPRYLENTTIQSHAF